MLAMGRIFEVRKHTMFARWNRMAKQFARISKDISIAVKSGGTDPASNPMLRRTIQAAGGEMPRAVMVGDSETDIATARAAGIPVVAVDFGYSEMPVATLGPDRLIGHFDDLASAILAIAPAR